MKMPNRKPLLTTKSSPALIELRYEIYLKPRLDIFRTKEIDFRRVGGHEKAAIAARDLAKNIHSLYLIYLNTDLSTQEFIDGCQLELDNARKSELKNHRGWKNCFAQLMSAIITVALGFTPLLLGRGFFGLFPTPTKSIQDIDDLEITIHRQFI